MSDSKTFSIFTFLLLLPASVSNDVCFLPNQESPQAVVWGLLKPNGQKDRGKSWVPLDPTGFVEKINCATSNTVEYKSCHSFWMEDSLFWRFEGVVMGLLVVFVLLVAARQRTLDHLASEKVRRQFQSI